MQVAYMKDKELRYQMLVKKFLFSTYELLYQHLVSQILFPHARDHNMIGRQASVRVGGSGCGLKRELWNGIEEGLFYTLMIALYTCCVVDNFSRVLRIDVQREGRRSLSPMGMLYHDYLAKMYMIICTPNDSP